MELTQLRKIVEGALLAADQPLNLNRLKRLFDEQEQPETDDLKAALDAIAADCETRGFELKEVGSGWRFQVRSDLSPWINRLWDEKPQKYSRALLETLALVAYRQPITRGDIEEIRGVAVSSHIIKTLTEREWIKAVGHRDVPGRPALYATTRTFLDYFNLKNLEELPSLGEIRDLNDMNAALDLDGDGAGRTGDERAEGESDAGDNKEDDEDRTEGAANDTDEQGEQRAPQPSKEAAEGQREEDSTDAGDSEPEPAPVQASPAQTEPNSHSEADSSSL